MTTRMWKLWGLKIGGSLASFSLRLSRRRMSLADRGPSDSALRFPSAARNRGISLGSASIPATSR